MQVMREQLWPTLLEACVQTGMILLNLKCLKIPVTYSLSSMLRRACDGDVSTHIFRSFSSQMAPKQIAPRKRPVQPAPKRPAPRQRPVQPAPVEPGIDKRPAESLDLWAQHGLNKPPPPVEVNHAPLLN